MARTKRAGSRKVLACSGPRTARCQPPEARGPRAPAPGSLPSRAPPLPTRTAPQRRRSSRGAAHSPSGSPRSARAAVGGAWSRRAGSGSFAAAGRRCGWRDGWSYVAGHLDAGLVASRPRRRRETLLEQNSSRRGRLIEAASLNCFANLVAVLTTPISSFSDAPESSPTARHGGRAVDSLARGNARRAETSIHLIQPDIRNRCGSL